MTETEQLSTIDALHRKTNDTTLDTPLCSVCKHAWPCRTHLVLRSLPHELSPAIRQLRSIAYQAGILLQNLRKACEEGTVRPEHALIASIQLPAKDHQDTTREHLERLLAELLQTKFSLTTSAWDQPDNEDGTHVRLLEPASTATLAAIADLHQQRQGREGKYDRKCKDCYQVWPCDSYAAATGLPQGSGKAVSFLDGQALHISFLLSHVAETYRAFPEALDHLDFVRYHLEQNGTSSDTVDLLMRFLTSLATSGSGE